MSWIDDGMQANFASVTEVGRLFQIADTAELKARLPYAVWVRGAHTMERSVLAYEFMYANNSVTQELRTPASLRN